MAELNDIVNGLTTKAARSLDEKLAQGGTSLEGTTPRQILGRPVSRTVTDNDALEAGDAFKVLDVNIATGKTITINNSIFSSGDECLVYRRGVGAITFVAGSGVTITSSYGLLVDNGENNIVTILFTSASACKLINGSPVSLVASDVNNALGYTAANAANHNLAWTRVVKSSAQSAITSTSYIDITDLLFPITSGVMMEYRGVIYVTSTNATEGVGISITGPTLTSRAGKVTIANTTTSDIARSSTVYDGETPTATLQDLGALCEVIGRVQTSASGNIQFRVRAETGSGQSVAVLAGSYIEYRPSGV